MVHNKLRRLGFSEKEAAIYAALVQYGPSPASTLANRTGIKRTSVYDILATLMERNLASSFRQGTHTYYAVDDFNKLYLEEKERLGVAERLVKEFRDEQFSSPGIKVHYYKGVEGYREMYEEILRIRPKELLGWMNLDRFYDTIQPEREKSWTRERIEKGIHVRLILQETELTRRFKDEDGISNRETRFASKDSSFESTCLLYGDCITFFDSVQEIIGIRIHNRELAKMQKAIFEMNWERLAPVISSNDSRRCRRGPYDQKPRGRSR